VPLARTAPYAHSIGVVASTAPEPPGTQQPQPRRPQQGIVVARPFGIPVYISPYWFVIAGVFVFVYASELAGQQSNTTTRYVLAIAFVVLLYLSVLLHELSHSIVARGYGLPVRRILLYPLGGISEIERDPETPVREFTVSAAGPALSFVLCAIGYALARVIPAGIGHSLAAQLGWANLVVGIFNLLPGLPLDGGRMLRAVIWKITGKPGTSTIAAAWAGRVIAIAMVVVPLATGMMTDAGGNIVSALWLVVIAVFMWTGATQAIRATKFRERLPSLQARRLARKAISVTAATPLAEAIRRAEESQARAVVVVDHEDKPIAIVNETAVMATPPQRRPWIDAGSLARTLEPSLVLSADLSGLELLNAISRAPATEYLLVEPSGQVFGVLAARDVDLAFAGV
jgi:Zn-dependent protease/CBS domain-containing protein